MKNLRITVNGTAYDVQVEELLDSAAPAAPAAAPVKPAAPAAKKPAASGAKPVSAPMPGTILDIKVSEGQSVESGEVLVILEAMKMENEIKAPEAGTIASIAVSKGESVDTGATLITLS